MITNAQPQQTLDTASQVAFSEPAGFWVRVGATLVDAIVLAPITIVTFLALTSWKSLPLIILLTIPGLLYKPLMESLYGATIGKKVCGVRVVSADGERLSLKAAYIRYAPYLVSSLISLGSTVWLFSQPEYAAASGLLEVSAILQGSPLSLFSSLMNWVILGDCMTAALTERKRAVHDMLADSYCIRTN